MTEIDRKFLQSIVNRVNASVKNEGAMTLDRLAHRQATRAKRPKKLKKNEYEMHDYAGPRSPEERETQYEMDYVPRDPEEERTMRAVAIEERQVEGRWFNELATDGHLSEASLEELQYFARGVKFEPRISARARRIDWVPKFDNDLARVAHAVISLASAPAEGGYKVRACAWCGTFMLIEPGRGMSKRRFCSTKHNNAAMQARARDRLRAKSARRDATRG